MTTPLLLRRSGALALAVALPFASVALPLQALAQTPPAPAAASAPAAPALPPETVVAQGERLAGHRRRSRHRGRRPGAVAARRRRGPEEEPAHRLPWSTSRSARRPPRRPRSATRRSSSASLPTSKSKLLLDEYLEREAKKAVTPEAAKALSDQTLPTMKPEEEAHARHILVDMKKRRRRSRPGSRVARTSPRSQAEVSKDPARRPRAAISAGSPRSAWSPPSRRPPSSSRSVRSPTRSRRSSAGT